MRKSNYLFLLGLIVFISCSSSTEEELVIDKPETTLDTLTVDNQNSELNGMERLLFDVLINAKPEVVYNTLIDSVHFSEWTAVFSPTSHFKGNWEQGSTMHFLSEEEGGFSGMLSTIKEHRPKEFISIEHIGFIQNGVEITEGEEVDKFKGAMENYTFVEQGDQTLLKVESDSFMGMKDFLLETWPKALDRLKNICENQAEES